VKIGFLENFLLMMQFYVEEISLISILRRND